MANAFVIGYKNHAGRIIQHLLDKKQFDNIYVYHPDKRKLSGIDSRLIATSNMDDVAKCHCVFIASPSETHCSYLKDIWNARWGYPYVYCEKPIATTQNEIDWLRENQYLLSSRVFTGFNFTFSEFYKKVEEHISSGKIGKPVAATFQFTHGLAFKEGMNDSWRFNNPDPFSSITGNLGIHFIHLCKYLFGNIEVIQKNESNFTGHSNPDTSSIQIQHTNGVVVNILLSYSTAFNNHQVVYFTDGVVQQIGETLAVCYPRDNFNQHGEFCSPTVREVLKGSGRDDTLRQSLDFFIETALNSGILPTKPYEISLETSEIILELQKTQ